MGGPHRDSCKRRVGHTTARSGDASNVGRQTSLLGGWRDGVRHFLFYRNSPSHHYSVDHQPAHGFEARDVMLIHAAFALKEKKHV